MRKLTDIEAEIETLKRVLEITAKQQHYDLGHPLVIAISQKLDRLIVQLMKSS